MTSGPRVKGYEKTVVGGITFHSKKEARYYQDLLVLKLAGTVTAIECQPEFELQEAYRKCCGVLWVQGILSKIVFERNGDGILANKKNLCPRCGKKMPAIKAITYRADFRVTYADGHVEIVDVKGYETPEFKRTRKMFEYQYPEFTLKIVKGVRR
jgi:hypothetical protein